MTFFIQLLLLTGRTSSVPAVTPWYQGLDCEKRQERCLGTNLWCDERWSSEGYESVQKCVEDRKPPMQWLFPRGDCPFPIEACLGTDEVCGRESDLPKRLSCFEQRYKAPWSEPKSEGCLTDIRSLDERCRGTQAWCESTDSSWRYESVKDNCLAGLAFGEACLGTDEFCTIMSEGSKNETFKCLATRSRPWFFHPHPLVCAAERSSKDERCIGTLAHCESEQLRQTYDSVDDCVKARRGAEYSLLLPWHYKTEGCNSDREDCVGTDMICSRLELRQKSACVEAREVPPFLVWLSETCPDRPGIPGRRLMAKDSEYCLGTAKWCASQFRISYDTEKSCRHHRSIKHFLPESKTPSRWILAKRPLSQWHECPENPELCMGTEEFCGQLIDPDRILSCLEARELSPFFDMDSPRCHAVDGSNDWEACRGTQAWCRDPDNLSRLYNGSEHICLKLRNRSQGGGPYPWQYGGSSGCEAEDRDEHCVGTERMCSRARNATDCLAERKEPLFLLSDPTDCFGAKNQLEPCVGTDAWCLGELLRDSNITTEECFSRRGFRRKGMREEMMTRFKYPVKELILKYGGNLAMNAAYWDLLVKQSDNATAMTAVVRELEGYMDGLWTILTTFVVPDVMNRVERLMIVGQKEEADRK
ncbi:hypothetical protein XA68_12343 [Ophiocordyceps unilateralis]|uniref:Uncharacterized protein n=1 Tax=Ophiocordyceps unilateralis TaxID=268505 RepID=A0A2A9PQ85_OPHUN|nr:hypothetical protein XA68_12343 [Ophiocordyceps unilateralis]